MRSWTNTKCSRAKAAARAGENHKGLVRGALAIFIVVDTDDRALGRERQQRPRCVVVADPVVDRVGDQHEIMLAGELRETLELVVRQQVASRICREVGQQRPHLALSDGASEPVPVESTVLGDEVHDHRLAARVGDDVAAVAPVMALHALSPAEREHPHDDRDTLGRPGDDGHVLRPEAAIGDPLPAIQTVSRVQKRATSLRSSGNPDDGP